MGAQLTTQASNRSYFYIYNRQILLSVLLLTQGFFFWIVFQEATQSKQVFALKIIHAELMT